MGGVKNIANRNIKRTRNIYNNIIIVHSGLRWCTRTLEIPISTVITVSEALYSVHCSERKRQIWENLALSFLFSLKKLYQRTDESYICKFCIINFTGNLVFYYKLIIPKFTFRFNDHKINSETYSGQKKKILKHIYNPTIKN